MRRGAQLFLVVVSTHPSAAALVCPASRGASWPLLKRTHTLPFLLVSGLSCLRATPVFWPCRCCCPGHRSSTNQRDSLDADDGDLDAQRCAHNLIQLPSALPPGTQRRHTQSSRVSLQHRRAGNCFCVKALHAGACTHLEAKLAERSRGGVKGGRLLARLFLARTSGLHACSCVVERASAGAPPVAASSCAPFWGSP